MLECVHMRCAMCCVMLRWQTCRMQYTCGCRQVDGRMHGGGEQVGEWCDADHTRYV